MNGRRERERWRINQYVQLHSAFLKSYFSVRHHLRGKESSRKGQRDVEWWAVQPDQQQAHFRRPRPAAPSVARRAGAVGVDPHQIDVMMSAWGHVCFLCSSHWSVVESQHQTDVVALLMLTERTEIVKGQTCQHV